MLYKFKCQAAGDLIMLGPNGDALMRVLGRAPAAQGIIEPADMPAAQRAIEQAVAADEAARSQAEQEALLRGEPLGPREGITPRQRLWPMIELLRRAHSAEQPVVWGV
jgi:hypothetical protein